MLASVAAALALPTILIATESQRSGGSPTTLSIEVAVKMFVLYVLYPIFYFRSPEGHAPFGKLASFVLLIAATAAVA